MGCRSPRSRFRRPGYGPETGGSSDRCRGSKSLGMTHLPAPALPPRHPRRRPAHRLALALALACGIGPVTPAGADTVLRGTVTFQAMASSKLPGARESAPAYSELVIYVTEKPGGAPLAGRAKRQDMDLAGEKFDPRVLAITVGSKVRFRNKDGVYHSLFSVTTAGRTEVGSIAPGAKREARFDRVGVNNLFCTLHPAAAGFIVVCPNWFHTGTNAAGEYT